MDDAVFHPQGPLAIQGQRPGQDLPLRLFHNTPLERFGCVSLPDLHGLLQNDGTAGLRRDKIRRSTGDTRMARMRGWDLMMSI